MQASKIPKRNSASPASGKSNDAISRPASILSGSLSPSLEFQEHNVPCRPRRLWSVRDTSLRPIPKFYPKLDPKCTTYVSDASPSVVAVRISECLRKRSICAEYDEEAVSYSRIFQAMSSEEIWLIRIVFEGYRNGNDGRPMSLCRSLIQGHGRK